MRKYVLVADFAETCGISKWTIYKRIKEKEEEFEESGVISWEESPRKIYRPDILYTYVMKRHNGDIKKSEIEDN